jgi:hypothetical protein
VEGLRFHAIYGRLLRSFLSIIVSIDYSFIFILPVDEVEIVLAIGVKLDRSIRHELIIASFVFTDVAFFQFLAK